MSENNQGAALPACWNAAVFPQGESWAWVAWQDGNKFSRMQGGATNEALAWDGARKMIDEQQKPPAPPAWMVEVAREARAIGMDAAGMPMVARNLRSGALDDDRGVAEMINALRLALERGHVVELREWTEDALLKAAREDAAQAYEANAMAVYAAEARSGLRDEVRPVQAALQARRNMLREGAVGVQTKAPEVDLEAALKRAWDAGWMECHTSHGIVIANATKWKPDNASGVRHQAVSSILSTLPTREA